MPDWVENAIVALLCITWIVVCLLGGYMIGRAIGTVLGIGA